MSAYSVLLERKKKMDEELQALGRGVLEEEFAKFLEEHPEVGAIKWRQYTPYFNDGETCVFGVDEFEIEVDGKFHDRWDMTRDHEYVEDGTRVNPWGRVEANYTQVPCTPKYPALAEAVKQFTRAVLDEDVFETAFGDHVKVTYSREGGFDVEEYDHD